MREILSTNDLVKISWFQALLSSNGIESVVLDAHTSVYYGGALIDRRVMVSDEDWERASRILQNSEQSAAS